MVLFLFSCVVKAATITPATSEPKKLSTQSFITQNPPHNIHGRSTVTPSHSTNTSTSTFYPDLNFPVTFNRKTLKPGHVTEKTIIPTQLGKPNVLTETTTKFYQTMSVANTTTAKQILQKTNQGKS